MPDTISKRDYFAIEIPDKPGEGVRILQALKDHGVNLVAFTGFPTGRRAQLDFIPEDAAALKSAAKALKLKLGAKKTCFVIEGDDRVGALTDTLARLAEAKINVTALDAVAAGTGRYGALFWVKPSDVNKAAKLLGASKPLAPALSLACTSIVRCGVAQAIFAPSNR